MSKSKDKITKTIALAGNPNVGKSTVFNELTGSSQHTGNWTGKTVDVAKDKFTYNFVNYDIYDLPGTYSLIATSKEEKISRDFIESKNYDCLVCVIDATNLERNLNLLLQISEVTDNIVILLNLCDEAKKRNIEIDADKLSELLKIPVVKATARSGKGINNLLNEIDLICNNKKKSKINRITYINPIEQALKILEDESIPRYKAIRMLENENIIEDEKLNIAYKKAKNTLKKFELDKNKFDEKLTSSIFAKSRVITANVQKKKVSKISLRENKLDNFLMGKYTSIPAILMILGVVLYITIAGSNYPSAYLQQVFNDFEIYLQKIMLNIGFSQTLISLLDFGILRVLLWVVAVMFPPMAIFFPLFAILEEFGLFPRIAFNLDSCFKFCGACGKQALTTCMGYGCNAVGVVGARIIDSKREQKLAIITNSLSPCNGRFPLLIAIISMFFTKNIFFASIILLSFLVLSLVMTLISSFCLTNTVLKGESSSFVLELPPYRKPHFIKTIWQSFKEKVVFVLLRAVVVAAPAGLVIWLLANVFCGESSLLSIISEFLEPFGKLLGMDGVILLGFILGFPANEIVIPIILMAYLSTGTLADYTSLESLKDILVNNGWTILTALNTCIFSMFHFPCSTTLITVYKETKSLKCTLLSVVTPLLVGVVLCIATNLVFTFA